MSVKMNLLNDKVLRDQLKQLQKKFPQEAREILVEVALVDVESYMKKNDIPVDTGRLRASIHTKFKNGMSKQYTPESETYSDNEGNTFDGTLSGKLTIDSVIVGTNVEYAEKINRIGGGGENSKRTVGGMKRSKGYGKGFFDNAVKNGEMRLLAEMKNLINRAGGLV